VLRHWDDDIPRQVREYQLKLADRKEKINIIKNILTYDTMKYYDVTFLSSWISERPISVNLSHISSVNLQIVIRHSFFI
jgi:hypothetical protein